MEICFCKCNQCNNGILWICLFNNLNFIKNNNRYFFFMTYKEDKSLWLRIPSIFRHCLSHYVMNSDDYN